MNRRRFLKGLASSVAAAAIAPFVRMEKRRWIIGISGNNVDLSSAPDQTAIWIVESNPTRNMLWAWPDTSPLDRGEVQEKMELI